MEEQAPLIEQIKEKKPKTYATLVRICEELGINPKAALATPTSPEFKAVYAVKDLQKDKQIQVKALVASKRVRNSLFFTLSYLIARNLLRRYDYSHPFLSRSRKLPFGMLLASFGVPFVLLRHDLSQSDLLDYSKKRAKLQRDYKLFESRLNQQVKLNFRRHQKSGGVITDKVKDMMDDDDQLDI